MSSITTVKQEAFIDTEKVKDWKVKIFGIGSIGGELTKQLALVGFQDITVYDFDTVDLDNIGSQVYTKEHVGMKKTKALHKLMKDWYDFPITAVDGEITEESEIYPEEKTVYFCGFDSLEARKLLWDKLKNFPIIWAESRIGRGAQRFYFLDLRTRNEKQIEEYEKGLDPNGPRTELKCGEKGCFPSNAELVGKLVRQFVNIAEGEPITQMMVSEWGYPPSIFIAPKREMPDEMDW